MPFSPTYPPAAPTITGDNISVSAFLANPTRVTRVVNDLTAERFIADRILGAGPPATGGAVIYDQVTASDLYLARDVEEIRPLADFPLLTDTAPTPLVAAVAKYGGEIEIAQESIDRNRYDVLARELTKLRNTIVRKVDAVAIAALTAAPKQTQTGVDFTTATAAQMVAVWVTAKGLIDNLDMGYDADLVVLNPIQADEMLSNTDLLKLLQPEGASQPLRTGMLGRMLDMDFAKSNRVTAGTAWVVASGAVGGLSQERGNGVLTNQYQTQRNQGWRVQGWRPVVPYITDPKASVLVSSL